VFISKKMSSRPSEKFFWTGRIFFLFSVKKSLSLGNRKKKSSRPSCSFFHFGVASFFCVECGTTFYAKRHNDHREIGGNFEKYPMIFCVHFSKFPPFRIGSL